MGYEEFSVSMANRSIRTIKTELEFLADNSLISRQQLNKILEELPTETNVNANAASVPAAAMNGLSLNDNRSNINEKRNDLYSSPSPAQQHLPPPAYNNTPAPPAAPAAPAVLSYATSLYPYSGTDAGDLSLQPNDRIAVTEYMNAEWWKGRNERTGQEGIFPRSYVRVEEKGMAPQAPMGAPQPSSYGNMPMQVTQDGSEPSKGKSTAQKLGGKLGNAAIFGAGATIGSNIVNSIF